MNVDEMIKESVNRLPHKTATERKRVTSDGGTASIVKTTYKVDAAGNKEEIEHSYHRPEDILDIIWPTLIFILPFAVVTIMCLLNKAGY